MAPGALPAAHVIVFAPAVDSLQHAEASSAGSPSRRAAIAYPAARVRSCLEAVLLPRRVRAVSTTSRPPIFIVGSARSGTTLLRLVIDSHPEIACGPETHFLARMDDDQRRFGHQLARYGFQDSYWVAKYREFFESFKVEYMERKHKHRWAD